PLTYTEVFGRSLVELAGVNEKIVGITAAMPDGTGLKYLAKAFPDRFFDVGIAEQHAVTLAAGLACRGYRPVVAIYSTFLQRAYDQLIHDVCLQNLPVLFAIDRAGLVGEDGETHHGVFDISFLRPIPNLVIMSPKDELELKQMLLTALEHPGPVAIRYPRGRGRGVETKGEVEALPLGQAQLIETGEDILIIAIGSMVYEAAKAATMLKKDAINCQVINARFIKPLDEKFLLASILKINNVVTVEEQVLSAGFGSAVRELIGKHGLNNINLLSLGLPDSFVPHGESNLLRENFGLTASKIVQVIKKHYYQAE
ncbi:MAG: transketolase C-terminal domain-containing protein, partial [Bacillota bacterium]